MNKTLHKINKLKSEPLSTVPLSMMSLVTQNQCIFVICEDVNQARQLEAAWRFFYPQKNIIYFSDWEILPYEHLSPNPELISERLLSLWMMLQKQVDVIITTVSTSMQKLPPKNFTIQNTFWITRGDEINLDSFRENLVLAGYQHVSHVVGVGEFSIRGGIIDLFPMGSSFPFRLDLFDNEIEHIKTFDAETQRTKESVESIRLLPAYEFSTGKEAQQIFRENFRELVRDDFSDAIPYKVVSKGIFGAGTEYYFPLFFKEPCIHLFDYLPKEHIILTVGAMNRQADSFEKEIKNRFQYAQGDPEYPPLEPHLLFMSAHEWHGTLKQFSRYAIDVQEIQPHQILPDIAIDRNKDHPLGKLERFLNNFQGKVLICAESLGRSETLLALLSKYHIELTRVMNWQSFLESPIKHLLTVSADIFKGFILDDQSIAVITESDLYQHTIFNKVKRRRHISVNQYAFHDLAEINIDDYVVHESHGIGRYKGLKNIDLGEGQNEFMLLEYANHAQLYLPVSQLNLISRYSGQKENAINLNLLGKESWSKAKKKALEKARDTAAELLHIYAKRSLQKGYAFKLDEESYQEFVAGFKYEETEDQTTTIVSVIKDLMDDKPMDRLVCGDVGFGKTEVALRAAFIAAMNGKQIAILAPTTLLVEQHTEVFSSRFSPFPIRVAQLSRFVNSKKTKEVLKEIKEGKVDIIIGTHKLLQPDVHFKNLGLLIIDEEHRFGVNQKEKFKKIRANIDILAMTATPIPRTLSMALEGIRDFSMITTAPSRRLSVKTFVHSFSESIIKEAVLREMKRNGQIFFLHNELDTIENLYEKLSFMVPEARICIAHGKLHERDLEHIMREFLRHHYDIMLCSTIIETGIDIPNANTIIINRADKFGIAQLHQLRGRVGRSYHQAYAYLLTPEYITKDAERRLDAIVSANELGSGFFLAMQDLEIRGSGDILGEGQSGEMVKVGLSLYAEMLKKAINALKQGKELDLDEPLNINTEINLHHPALLPENYCPDIHERLVLYKKLAQSDAFEKIDDIQEELIDRFGLPNQSVKCLLEMHRIRILAEKVGILAIDAYSEKITFTFSNEINIDPKKIIELIQSEKYYKLEGASKLKATINIESVEQRIIFIKKIIKQLSF